MIEQLLDDIHFINQVTKKELIMLAQVSLLSYIPQDELYKNTKLALENYMNEQSFQNKKQLTRLIVAMNHVKGGM